MLPHATLAEFYASPDARQSYVNTLFDRTASDYDAVCGVLSMGSGLAYRRRALRRVGVGAGSIVLDVATGTGQIARAALELGVRAGDLYGVDPSPGMLAAHIALRRMRLARGLADGLPFRDASFDHVLMGYALRHVADLDAAFSEFRRVLKPGGRVLVLEITRPRSRFLAGLVKQFLVRGVPPLARLRGCQRGVGELLRYYWATIEHCVPPDDIVAALARSGLTDVRRSVVLGVLSEYSAAR